MTTTITPEQRRIAELEAALKELFVIFVEGGYAEDEDGALLDRIYGLLEVEP